MKCIYCGQEVIGNTKTNEHVIPKWITNYLKAGKISLEIKPISCESHIFPPRNTVAMTMTHKICDTCNNGWLSKIDNSCKDLLIDLLNANHLKKSATINHKTEDVKNLYALIYKIFLNFMATGPFKLDKLPFYRAFYEKPIPPHEVILFYCDIATSKPISIGHLDNWSCITNKNLIDWSVGSESGLRFKFFVQLGYSSFVLCCTGNTDGKIVYDDMFLHPIFDFVGSTVQKSNLEPPLPPVDDNIVNRILWSIKLDQTCIR
jgi:hypothetical protein